MANIIIKNAAGTEVIAKDIDTVVLPTTNGGTATFRQWNGLATSSAPAVAYKKKNIMLASGYIPTVPTISITKGV